MKKIFAWLLVLSLLFVTFSSCDLIFDRYSDGTDNAEDSEADTYDPEEGGLNTEESSASVEDNSHTSDGDRLWIGDLDWDEDTRWQDEWDDGYSGATPNDELDKNKTIFAGFCTKDSLYDGTFNSSVGWKAAGMGYVIRTKSGKLIVIDGGNVADDDGFYELLQQYSDTEFVVVDYWIITHPHIDHAGSLWSLANGSYDLIVKNLVFDCPRGFRDSSSGNSSSWVMDLIDYSAEYLGANTITPKKGQKITVDEVEIEFLYTPSEDYWELTNVNELSLIFTVKAEKKVMITGDAFNRSLQKVTNAYGSSLKCDVLQMPHHFLCDTGYKPFYEYVDAQTVLLPTCKAGYNAMYNDPDYNTSTKHLANKYAVDNADYVYKAFEGNFAFNI